jgi:hypothetical protein
MTYTTVFDATHQGYTTWWFPAFGFIFLTVFARRLFWPPLERKPPLFGLDYRSRKTSDWVMFVFSILWISCTFFLTFHGYLNVHEALASGNYQVVQGQVSDFVPMPYGGHSMESFCVSGQCFSYSDYVVISGFNHTASHGGPIREGLNVRVSYIGNTIIKLEMAQ